MTTRTNDAGHDGALYIEPGMGSHMQMSSGKKILIDATVTESLCNI